MFRALKLRPFTYSAKPVIITSRYDMHMKMRQQLTSRLIICTHYIHTVISAVIYQMI